MTSNHIQPKNKECSVVPVEYEYPIVLTKLKKGLSINMTLTAKRGIEKTHTKWSPVCTCVMRPGKIKNYEFLKPFAKELDSKSGNS